MSTTSSSEGEPHLPPEPPSGEQTDSWCQRSFIVAATLAHVATLFPRLVGAADMAVGNEAWDLARSRSDAATTERLLPRDVGGIYAERVRPTDPRARSLRETWRLGRQAAGGPGEDGALFELREVRPGETLVEAFWSADLAAYMEALFVAWGQVHPEAAPPDPVVPAPPADSPLPSASPPLSASDDREAAPTTGRAPAARTAVTREQFLQAYEELAPDYPSRYRLTKALASALGVHERTVRRYCERFLPGHD